VRFRRTCADITPGGRCRRSGAPARTASTILLTVPFYSSARSNCSFLAILLPTDYRRCICFLAGPLRPCESFSRALDVILQHVRAVLLSHRRDRRASTCCRLRRSLCQILSPVYMERPREPLPIPCARCRALSSRGCPVTEFIHAAE
jgi:hypothetical protein